MLQVYLEVALKRGSQWNLNGLNSGLVKIECSRNLKVFPRIVDANGPVLLLRTANVQNHKTH